MRYPLGCCWFDIPPHHRTPPEVQIETREVTPKRSQRNLLPFYKARFVPCAGDQFCPIAGHDLLSPLTSGYSPRSHPSILLFEQNLDRKSTRLNSSHVAISYAV